MIGVTIMKMMSSTNITSMSGVTLMSALTTARRVVGLGPPRAAAPLEPLVSRSDEERDHTGVDQGDEGGHGPQGLAAERQSELGGCGGTRGGGDHGHGDSIPPNPSVGGARPRLLRLARLL